jgi:hypothetical protein
MKTPLAARFSIATLVAAVLYAFLIMVPGLRIVGVSFPRQAWIAENPMLWSLGLWLWLAAIFCWMWVIVSLMWAYLPAHRISSMLQSGLLIISATLAICGVVVWMAALPAVLPLQSVNELLPLVDSLALGLLGAGALMGGVVVSWNAIDLMRHSPLRRGWVAVAVAAGVLMAPSPFLFPFPWHVVGAAACWLFWTLYLASMHRLPSAYPEMR